MYSLADYFIFLPLNILPTEPLLRPGLCAAVKHQLGDLHVETTVASKQLQLEILFSP